MMRSISIVVVIAGLAAAAAAQPAGGGSGSGSGAAAGAQAPIRTVISEPADLKGQCVALFRTDGVWFKEQCTAATVEDQTWATELVSTPNMVSLVKRIHGEDLVRMSKQAHIDDAARIAKDKRHVIMAYAAMWLLSVGFLVFLWRRQQGLHTRIAQLKKDLDAALKDSK